MSLFERVAAASGRLLKAERARSASQGLVLTFDVGRVWARAAASGDGLVVRPVGSASEVPGGLEDATEEEPWWRLIGNELARVAEADDEGGGVRLQFRRDEDNPRVVRLASRDDTLHATLESTAH